MNKRVIDIMFEIIKNKEGSNFKALSDQFEVSQRTIRNEINLINEFFAKNQLPEFAINANGNILFVGDKKRTIELAVEINSDFYTYKLSKNEREVIASIFILNTDGYITINEIANEILVSRQTLINDLEVIKSMFESFDLEIRSNHNKGLKVRGAEENKRRMMLSILQDHVIYEGNEEDGCQPFSNLVLKSMVAHMDQTIFERIINKEEQAREVFFTDAAYREILYFLVVLVKRLQMGKFVENVTIPVNNKYEMAETILMYLGTYYKLEILEAEILYFADFLHKQRCLKERKQVNTESIKIQMQVNRFVSAISGYMNVDLSRDFLFYENLCAHLENTLMHRSGPVEKNPVLDILYKNYPEIFEITRKYIYHFEDCAEHDMSEDEISYVVMHICAAIERKKGTTPARAIVVCSGGVGTSQLLVEKLKQQFGFQIVEITALHNLKEEMAQSVDIVISTIPIRGATFPYVQVSPLLDDSDYLKIQKNTKNLVGVAHKIEEEKAYTAKEVLHHMVPLVNRYVDVEENKMKMIKEMADVLEKLFQEKTTETTQLLHEYISPDHITLDVHCKDYEEAIRKSAEVLVEQGYVTQTYVDAMIDNINENGPYFVLSKGFALPHAMPETGVLRRGFSFIRLAEPVYFRDETEELVEFVCCLSAENDEGHKKALFNLMSLLKRPDFVAEIKGVQTSRGLHECIKKHETTLKK
ncbi:BglG family transcription antiterminator [Chakrabartyella piscis]|uniref:BglG family transcription antiterminator n=1 Tax=Chakrabartyella piscis TaxID=2918914 RepID=UPI002958404A|nr:BglG family transcription antiterminator [Chakrabartyella piscis]